MISYSCNQLHIPLAWECSGTFTCKLRACGNHPPRFLLVPGKTTLLRYLLEQTSLRIGCVVNDVASINIDAKLIRNDRNREQDKGAKTTSDLADTVELANGCACELCLPHLLLWTIAICLCWVSHQQPCLTLPDPVAQAAASRTSFSAPSSSCSPWQTARASPTTGAGPPCTRMPGA
jgi:hypothetical protein